MIVQKMKLEATAVYVFKQLLKILHPFIPFVTEEIWLNNKFDNSSKDYLMYSNWPNDEAKKDQSSIDVQKIIDIISDLRSFKNELNVSPGSFTDISIKNLNKDSQKFIKELTSTVLKKLGRINKFS
jgi:valyl-tRNA synthetase